MKRKLAAIMAGDIVGYSRLMADNEATTYTALRSVFDDLILPTIARHGGRTFKTSGDGFLATFPSVNEALDAAVAIQNGFDARPFELRIGINLGDVIEDNGDMYGDGVNVAARLETMAQPGGIFVSGAVVLGADRNRGEEFLRIGRRQAKTIPERLDVYAVKRPGHGSSFWNRIARVHGGGRAWLAYGVGATALLLVGLAWQHAQVTALLAHLPERFSSVAGRTDTDPRPSIAVMPFANMSGDTAQDYFADGLTEDVTTELARNSGLQVIARNSAYAVRDEAGDIRKVGAKLGVSYVVEGSARKVGDQVRIAAQLIDVNTGTHLWSRSFDRKVADVFSIESELTAEIASNLVSFVVETETAEAAKHPTKNPRAYDLVLQARGLFKHDSMDGTALLAARGLYLQAMELDPAYAVARAQLGMTYILDASQNISGRATPRDVELGLSEARQSIRLDPTLALGYQVISFGLAASGKYADALQAAQRAVELSPNDPDSMMALAKAQVRFGDYAGALRNAERARRLHPMAPEYYAYVHGRRSMQPAVGVKQAPSSGSA